MDFIFVCDVGFSLVERVEDMFSLEKGGMDICRYVFCLLFWYFVLTCGYGLRGVDFIQK